MPEKFHTGGSGGGPKSGGTRRLVIILIVVTAVAALGVAGLYVFQRVMNNSNANANTNLVVNANRNANTNISNANTTNANVNANVNGSTNVNGNVNTNGNLNINASNTNVSNINAATNTNSPVSLTPLPSSTDTDSDGLTDIEEVLWTTDVAKPDTDSDTFIDGRQVRADGTTIGEIYLAYNPTGTGSLESSTLVKRLENGAKQYSLLVPTAWTTSLDSSGGILITPAQDTGEFFQTRVNDNPQSQTPQQWYLTINPSSSVSLLKTDKINGLEVIYSEDQSTVYLFHDTQVYSFQYSSGTLVLVNYRTTFEMMLRSFRLVSAS